MMKIQCSVCESAEATVLCCADEAALCYACDEKIHAANKLASKHQRVSLSHSNSPMPKCDICQETVGYFFCLEDRALLCRKCDFSIHSVNTYVLAHRRFLLTGVKVGLEPIEHSAPPSSRKSIKSQSPEAESRPFPTKEKHKAHSPDKGIEGEPRPMSGMGELKSVSPDKVIETASLPLSVKGEHKSLGVQEDNGSSFQVPGAGDFAPTKLPFSGGSESEGFEQWQLDEIFGLGELGQNYNHIENGSSKADSNKLRDLDYSPLKKFADLEMNGDDSIGQIPETAWAVPELLSSPITSGIYWLNGYEHQIDTAPAFVPDVCYSPLQNPYHHRSTGPNLKRRRQ